MMELLSDICRIYMTTLCMVVCWLFQMVKNRERKSRCSFASIGSWPKRKYRAGIGELLLSFRKLLRILWWKTTIGLMIAGLMGRDESPEQRTGRL